MTPFAFLHGGGQGGWVWRPTIAALRAQSAHATSLSLDVPGCGEKRGRQTEDLTIWDVAAELVADIESAGLEAVTLVGHSQAGTVLPIMAEIAPKLIRKLIYVSCAAPKPGQTLLELIGNAPRGAFDDQVGMAFDPELVTDPRERNRLRFCNDMSAAMAEAFLDELHKDGWPRQTYAAREWSYDRLGAIDSAYVVCLRDLALPAAWQHTFAARLRVKRVVSIDAGHQPMISRPHGLAEILLNEESS